MEAEINLPLRWGNDSTHVPGWGINFSNIEIIALVAKRQLHMKQKNVGIIFYISLSLLYICMYIYTHIYLHFSLSKALLM